MPRGDKSSYTGKQKRKAQHIEEGYEERGVSKDEAEERAWRTVNKQDKGGKKSGSGRKRGAAKKSSARKSPARKSAKKVVGQHRNPLSRCLLNGRGLKHLNCL